MAGSLPIPLGKQKLIKKNGKSEKQAKFCQDALVFFYSNVVSSEKHVEALKQNPAADWLKIVPSEKDVTEIKRFQLYLKEDRNYSPRTVNLVTAAIQFFYLNVLRSRLPFETLPRMKTGRSLPKVYSEQEIEKLLKSVENPKHRLLLMLAYGCGLRLEELRTLKTTDFDFHKDLLRLRS